MKLLDAINLKLIEVNRRTRIQKVFIHIYQWILVFPIYICNDPIFDSRKTAEENGKWMH